MGKLMRRFEFLTGASAEEVLQHSKRIAGEIEAQRKQPVKTIPELVDEKTLLEELRRILQSPRGKPHHGVLYAVRKFGHGQRLVSKHFGVTVGAIKTADAKASDILARPLATTPQMTKSKIMDKLGTRNYSDLEQFLQHMSSISTQILGQPKRPVIQKPRVKKGYRPTELSRQVAEIALRLLGKTEKEVEKEELRKKMIRIQSTLGRLKRSGIISQSTKPRVRIFNPAPTSSEIEGHKEIAREFLRRGHAFVRSDWRKYFDEGEAETFADRGLVRALQRFDPSRGIPFPSYARYWIAQAIGHEATKRANRARREKATSFDAPRSSEDERTLHDTIAAPAVEEDKERSHIEKMFKLHKKGAIVTQELVVGTLLIAGHNQTDIARFFGTSRQRINQIRNKTTKNLRRFTTSE